MGIGSIITFSALQSSRVSLNTLSKGYTGSGCPANTELKKLEGEARLLWSGFMMHTVSSELEPKILSNKIPFNYDKKTVMTGNMQCVSYLQTV
jgi:hypothetical protein